jgi:hypothetical protein
MPAYIGGAVVLIALAVLVSRLAIGPVHGVDSAEACKRAYANAKTRADSVSVATLSFPDPARQPVPRRCSEFNTVYADAPGR